MQGTPAEGAGLHLQDADLQGLWQQCEAILAADGEEDEDMGQLAPKAGPAALIAVGRLAVFQAHS